MKVIALVSGGKDSCFSLLKCQQHGHQVVALANLCPVEDAPDDLDSYCFQTVGHNFIDAFATCTGLPLFRLKFRGHSANRELEYMPTQGDEVEDLVRLLAFAKESIPDIQGVCSGAIASDYQRLRVEHVCSRLQLTSLAYLWHKPQAQLLTDMVEAGIVAIIVKVACLGLTPSKHLGKTLAQMLPVMLALQERYGCNVCGEGGEYETITLDCPSFTKAKIVLKSWEIDSVTEHALDPVALLRPTRFELQPKYDSALESQPPQVRYVPTDFAAPAAPITSPANKKSENAASTSRGDRDGAAVVLHGEGRPRVCVTGAGGMRSMSVRAAAIEGGEPSGAQTAAALRAGLMALAEELESMGMTWAHVLFVHLHLADMSHFLDANAAYCAVVTQTGAPSRACVQLPLPPGCPYQVDVLVTADATRDSRRVLHVQSHSEWAPACIGPYSQATVFNGVLRMAGQIPLEPATMQVISEHEPARHVERCLRSCEAVATALRCDLATSLLSLLVYHTDVLDADSCHLAVQRYLEDAGDAARERALATTHDIYLQAPPFASGPLAAHYIYAQVPRLPRDCIVEVQPVCVIAASQPAEASSEDSDNEAGRTEAHGQQAGWMHRLTSWSLEKLQELLQNHAQATTKPENDTLPEPDRAETSTDAQAESQGLDNLPPSSDSADSKLLLPHIRCLVAPSHLLSLQFRAPLHERLLCWSGAPARGCEIVTTMLCVARLAAMAAGLSEAKLSEVRFLYVEGTECEEALQRACTLWGKRWTVPVSPVCVPVASLHDGTHAVSWVCNVLYC